MLVLAGPHSESASNAQQERRQGLEAPLDHRVLVPGLQTLAGGQEQVCLTSANAQWPHRQRIGFET